MFTARQSPKVPVENQEEPLASIVFKSMLISPRIVQLERRCGFSNHILHGSLY